VALTKDCRNDSQRQARGFAHLLVTDAGSAKANIDFTCRHKRNNIRFDMEDCDLIFNLGQELPIQPSETDIMVRSRVIRVSFAPIYQEINDQQIPQNLYAGLVKVSRQAQAAQYYEPVLPHFFSISKDDFLDGQMTLRKQPNIQGNFREMIAAQNTKDLVLVFSTTPNLQGGLYHIEFSNLCADRGNSLIAGRHSEPGSPLCEQNNH
jgi:hypothetical protein